MVVATETYVRAIAVADFDGLVLGNAKSSCASEARTGLTGRGISYAAHSRHATPPEIAIQRYPCAAPEVATQVPFERADGLFSFGAGLGMWKSAWFVV